MPTARRWVGGFAAQYTAQPRRDNVERRLSRGASVRVVHAMKKVALYSSSSRTRRPAAIGAPEDASAASGPPVPPAGPTTSGRWRRFYARFERPILLVGGALFAIALIMTYAKSRPAAQEFTQKDIDAAVLHTLENARLPSFAAKAFAAIEPSVVRVMGYGPDATDDEDEGIDKEKRKGKDSEKSKAGKDGTSGSRDAARDKARSVAKDRLARNDSGKGGAGAGAEEKTGKSGADGKDGKDGKGKGPLAGPRQRRQAGTPRRHRRRHRRGDRRQGHHPHQPARRGRARSGSRCASSTAWRRKRR